MNCIPTGYLHRFGIYPRFGELWSLGNTRPLVTRAGVDGIKVLGLAHIISLKKNNVMETNEKLIEVLNDLIRINNDRIAGYEKAIDEVENMDVDLKALFQSMANESREYVSELGVEVARLGGEITTGTTNSGKIYRAWMDIKSAFSVNERAQKAYEEALASDADISVEVRQLITDQKAALKNSHDAVKRYRDLHHAANH
jgi:uncharacterized protein (TIGR02284 family)